MTCARKSYILQVQCRRNAQSIKLFVAVPKIVWIGKSIDAAFTVRLVVNRRPSDNILLPSRQRPPNCKRESVLERILKSFQQELTINVIGKVSNSRRSLERNAGVTENEKRVSERNAAGEDRSFSLTYDTASGCRFQCYT